MRQNDRSHYYGIALLILFQLVSVGIAVSNIHGVQNDFKWIGHTHEVIEAVNTLQKDLLDAETGQRGYVITEGDLYLAPYNAALSRYQNDFNRLMTLTSDNDDQQTAIKEFRTLADKRLVLLDDVIKLRRKGFLKAKDFILEGRGKTAMDLTRNQADVIIQTEHKLLIDRQNHAERSTDLSILFALVSTIIGLGIIGLAAALVERNIRARQKIFDSLQEQKERLAVTLSSLGDGVITTDEVGNVTNLNPVAQSLTGWTDDESHGVELTKVFNIINQDTRQPVENPALRSLKEGTIVGLANHTKLISKSGHEYHIDDSAAPIRDNYGHIIGSVLIFRDISERYAMEAESQRSRELLQTIYDSTEEYIGLVALDGTLLQANKASLKFADSELNDVIGKLFWDTVWFQYTEGAPEQVKQAFSQAVSGQSVQVEASLNDSKGDVRIFNISFTPVKDQAGKVIYVVPEGRDITEMRTLQGRLIEADKRKDEFLAILAHELRNPLAPLVNMLELIKRNQNDPGLLNLARETMERQLGHMVRIVDDLLDVSRISRGKIQLRKEKFEISSTIHLVIEAVKPICAAMKHDLAVELNEKPIYLDADQARIAQIIGNLLTNAAKFTDPGGKILLAVKPHEGGVQITVSDNGIGIEESQLDRIFEVFTQIDSPLKKSNNGLGIGLSLVKTLVDLHEGTISAKSGGLGQGSTFTVWLPASFEGETQTPVETAEMHSEQVQPKRILVVDDNQDAAVPLAMLLRMEGHETFLASDGKQALVMAEETRPDVILLDIGLPEVNGYEVARRIREQPWGTDIFIIALTGWGQDEDRRLAKEAGMNAHLVKPVDYAAVRGLIS